LPRLAATALLVVSFGLPALAGGTDLPAPLVPFKAEYRVTNGTIRAGHTRISLQPDAQGWRYESVTEAEGLFSLFVDGPATERTILEPHDGALRPLEYDHLEADGDRTVVRFDWEAGRAHIRTPDGERNLPLAPDTRDPFSAILAIMQAAAAGRDHVAFPGINDKGKPDPLRFERMGTERIKVPFGTFDAVRVRRIRDDKRSTVTWLAPRIGWIPVQIEQRKKGDLVARLELIALDGERAEPTSQPSAR